MQFNWFYQLNFTVSYRILYIDFTHVAASNTAIDDITT